MIHRHLLPALALLGCFSLSACKLPGTFVSYAQKERIKTGEYQSATQDARLSDALAFNYANSVASIFQARATGERYNRATSDTALAGLAAFTAASQTWTVSKHALGVLGLTGVGILELRKIFDSKARATAYLEASHRIRYAMKDFRAYNLNAENSDQLSPNGWILANVTMANIQIVEMLLEGRLPTPNDLEQASEPITPEGAGLGKNRNQVLSNLPAPSLVSTAPRRNEAEARLIASQLELIRIQKATAAEMEKVKKERDTYYNHQPKLKEFARSMKAVYDTVKTASPEEQNKKWVAVAHQAGLESKIKASGPPLKQGGPPTLKGEDIQEYYENDATTSEQNALFESAKMHAPPPP
ncbi:MAG: hypothetical protein NTY98_03710 [Verrucomicrobia bacterium]|nr:hypothetical protein [Verrucomicrobiota bacterium]